MRLAVIPHLAFWSIRTRGWQMARALAGISGTEVHFASWGTTEPRVQTRVLRGLDTLAHAITNHLRRAPRTRDGVIVHTLPFFDTRLVSLGVPISAIQAWNRRRLSSLLRELRPDWVITGGIHTAPVPGNLSIRTAVDLFDDHFVGVTDLESLRRVSRVAADALERAQLIIGSSCAITHKYSDLTGRSVVYVPNGYDSPPLVTETEKLLLRKRYRVPSNAKVVGYVGNHGTNAGIGFLLDVMTHLSERDSAIVCLIAGPIQDPRERHRAERHRAVRSLGAIPPEIVPQFLSICHAGVLPCEVSGFRSHALPIKILEYGANCLPVVATPLRELQLQQLPHVRLVAYSDIPAWVNALEAAVETPFPASWSLALERFKWPRIATELLSVLERMGP